MAGTAADKLAKLSETKADLKAALAEKGQTVNEVFSTYPAAVRAIETGKKVFVYDPARAKNEFEIQSGLEFVVNLPEGYTWKDVEDFVLSAAESSQMLLFGIRINVNGGVDLTTNNTLNWQQVYIPEESDTAISFDIIRGSIFPQYITAIFVMK